MEDELFIHIGCASRDGVRPIHIFLHLLRDRNFNLSLIPGVYGMMAKDHYISNSSAILLVVTLDQEKRRLTVINHPEKSPLHFKRKEVYKLFHQSLSLERNAEEMLVIGFHQFYFYTKFCKIPLDTGIRIPFGEGLEEIGQILYYHAF